MAKALKVFSEYEYVSPLDEDETPTTWILRSLDAIEFQSTVESGDIKWEQYALLGITGWRNFPDSDGNEIEYSKENIGRIPPAILQDLEIKIQALSVMTEDEQKN